MKRKPIEQIEWRPDIFEKPIKQIYISAEYCRDAGLYKLEDDRVIYHSYWLNAHGIGPDHCSYLLENIDDLKAVLEQDVKFGFLSKDKLKKLLDECREYFCEWEFWLNRQIPVCKDNKKFKFAVGGI